MDYLVNLITDPSGNARSNQESQLHNVLKNNNSEQNVISTNFQSHYYNTRQISAFAANISEEDLNHLKNRNAHNPVILESEDGAQQNTNQLIFARRVDLIVLGDNCLARSEFLESLRSSSSNANLETHNSANDNVLSSGINYSNYVFSYDKKKVESMSKYVDDKEVENKVNDENLMVHDQAESDLLKDSEIKNEELDNETNNISVCEFGIIDVSLNIVDHNTGLVSKERKSLESVWLRTVLKMENIMSSVIMICIDLDNPLDIVTSLLSQLEVLANRIQEIAIEINKISPDIILDDLRTSNVKIFANYILACALKRGNGNNEEINDIFTSKVLGNSVDKDSIPISESILNFTSKLNNESLDDISEIIVRNSSGGLFWNLGIPIVIIGLNSHVDPIESLMRDQNWLKSRFNISKNSQFSSSIQYLQEDSKIFLRQVLRSISLQVGASLCLIPSRSYYEEQKNKLGSLPSLLQHHATSNWGQIARDLNSIFAYLNDVRILENQIRSGTDINFDLISVSVPESYGITPKTHNTDIMVIPMGWDSFDKIQNMNSNCNLGSFGFLLSDNETTLGNIINNKDIVLSFLQSLISSKELFELVNKNNWSPFT